VVRHAGAYIDPADIDVLGRGHRVIDLLPHGGSRITKDVTRRSLVLHFVPRSVKPTFQKVVGANYHELARADGHSFASRHYRMAELDDQGRARLLYDGNVRPR